MPQYVVDNLFLSSIDDIRLTTETEEMRVIYVLGTIIFHNIDARPAGSRRIKWIFFIYSTIRATATVSRQPRTSPLALRQEFIVTP